MKKALSLILVLALVFVLAACGEKAPETDDTTTTTTVSETDATTTTVDSEITTTTTTTKATVKNNTTKNTTTTTKVTTTAAPVTPEYIIREDTHFSYSTPILATDYETNEQYYEMLYLGISFYPNGTQMMDQVYTQPVMDVSENTYHPLIPKENYPKAVEYAVEYMIMELTHGDENSTLTWSEAFEMIRKNEEYPIVKHNGVEYVEFIPPMGGFVYPMYSYTINNQNGDVTFSLLPGETDDSYYRLKSVKLALNTEKKLTAVYYKAGTEKMEIQMTGITW